MPVTVSSSTVEVTTVFSETERLALGGFLAGGHRLLSASEVVEHRKMLDDILRGMDQDMVGWWWHPDWMPFAAHVAADALVIDLRDGPQQGAIGEFMHAGNTNFDWVPPSPPSSTTSPGASKPVRRFATSLHEWLRAASTGTSSWSPKTKADRFLTTAP